MKDGKAIERTQLSLSIGPTVQWNSLYHCKSIIKLPFLSIPLFSLSGISSRIDVRYTHLEIPDREKGWIERKGNFINYFIVPSDLWPISYFVFLLDKCILFIYLIKLFFPLLHLNGCSFPGGNSKNMNNYPFQKKNDNNFNLNKSDSLCRMRNSFAWLPRKCYYRPDTRTDGRTDRRQTKLSICAAMLRRRHKNHNTWKNDCSSWD